MSRGVVFDLDGVIRHFSPGQADAAASEHGLEPNLLIDAAFRSGLLEQVVCGEITKNEWIYEVSALVGIPGIAEHFLRDLGTVDHSMLAIVERLRSSGVIVSILTNGTDAIPDELRAVGIDSHFDHVFNTHFIRSAKPAPGPFLHVADALGLAPEHLFFTDDRPDNVATAVSLGWAGHHFVGVSGFEHALSAWLRD